jgi:phenylpyruvate tautomerase PptA (4-oxalocrotonate tautomerase family)
MPYIAVNTAQELSGPQKEKIKTELGRLIALIPTKSEAHLLVDFSGGRTLYRAGKEVPGAFIEVRLYAKAPLESKKQLTQAIFDLFATEAGFKKEEMYLNILELDTWGTGGFLI